MIFLIVFRDVVLSSRKALALFGLGLGVFFVAALFDMMGVHAGEPVELLAAATLPGGFMVLTVESVHGAMAGGGRAATGSVGSGG